MNRKTTSRLLALVLVLCMVVLCVPVRAHAVVDRTRPDGLTDEEWEELLHQRILADQLKEQDALSSSDGDLTVTDQATMPADVPADAPGEAAEQSVSVELPMDAGTISEDGTVSSTEFTTQDGSTVTEEVSLDLDAKVTQIETQDGQVTDITYEISVDAAILDTVEDPEGNVTTPEEADKVEDVDKAINDGVPPTETVPFKVDMTVNGMVDDPTRVEHKYKVTKQVTTEAGDVVDQEVEETEYYYNAANGVDEQDTTKKYFTVSVVEKVIEGATSVKDKVISLCTSFLGIFHITNDAFENQKTMEMSSDLASAVNDAEKGETVEMLRDYTTDEAAEITTSKDVTVDLNGHAYTSTGKSGNAAVKVTGSNQKLTVKNGIINSITRAINVLGHNNTVKVEDTKINSDSRGVQVTGSGNDVTVERSVVDSKDIGVSDFNANNKITVKNSTIDSNSADFGIYHSGNYGGADISVIGSYVYADGSTGAGIYVSGSKSLAKNNKLTIKDSNVFGETGVEVKFTDVTVDNSYLLGFGVPSKYASNSNGSTTVGAALAITDNGDGVTGGTIVINSGWFEGSRDISNIYLAAKKNAGDPQATVTVKGGRFTNSDNLYDYIGAGYAAISHNDGSAFPYEVVGRSYVPTREGYRFLGYTDAKGNAITLADAYRRNVVAYAQWKALPETTTAKAAPLIDVKTDVKGCTARFSIKGDTAYVIAKNAKGEPAPISEVTVTSVKKLQAMGVDTIEIQVDEDVTLLLDIEKAKENGFTDTIEVTLEKDILRITSGRKTSVELDIAVLKASGKPVRIQLVEGELTVMLGKNSSMNTDLTKALKLGKRIVVKLENAVLKLFDQYNKPIQ